MSCQIINGQAIAQKLRDEISKEATRWKEAHQIVPGLTVILVGEDPASQIYVKNKVNACREVGFNSDVIALPADITEKQLLDTVEKINQDPLVHGLIVQLPLPDHIREEIIIKAIDPCKDVDGFHPINLGLLLAGNPQFIPCTPYGCLKLLEFNGVRIDGKHAVVVGRSIIVGKPMAALLVNHNTTVSICHSRTRNLKEMTRQADILVAAVGQPSFITGDMVKPGAVILDVGITRLPSGKLAGDVDFATASKIASMITPVPKGVGPMTIAMLLMNTLQAVKIAYERKQNTDSHASRLFD